MKRLAVTPTLNANSVANGRTTKLGCRLNGSTRYTTQLNTSNGSAERFAAHLAPERVFSARVITGFVRAPDDHVAVTAHAEPVGEPARVQLGLYATSARIPQGHRVRIALNLKGLAFESIPVNLVRDGGEQLGEAYRAINPQGLVPVLVHEGHVLTQSLSICEYLDERFDEYPLLPADPLARAWVRSLALQVACDIHPLNNLRVQKYLKKRWL